MKAIEWLTILLGLFGGFWLVSRLMGDKPDDAQREPPPVPPRERASNAPPPDAPPPAPTSLQPEPTWHEVLGVSPHADAFTIKSAYRRLMQQYHPDKVAHMGPEIRRTAETMSRRINDAYERAVSSR